MKKKKKNAALSQFGKLGGQKGGPARAASLTQKQRTTIASQGGAARKKAMSPEARAESARKASRARRDKAKSKAAP